VASGYQTTGGRIRGALAAGLLALAWCATPAYGADDDPLAQAETLLARDADQAERLATQGLADARHMRDAARQAQALTLLGLIQMRRGHHAAALTQLEAAVPLAEASGDELRLGRALASLGIVFDLSGLRSEALQVQQRALDLYLAKKDWARASAVLINLGNTYDNQDDRAAARRSYERALAMKREHGITRGIGSVLNNLSDFELDAGRGERAVELLREAIAAHQADGNVTAESLARSNAARALALTGHFDLAQVELDRAAALADAPADALAQLAAETARAQVALARVRAAPPGDARRTGWLDAAVQSADAARQRARGLEDHGRLADLARLLADLHVEQQRFEAAVVMLREAEREQAAEHASADAERYAVLAARYQTEKQAGEIALLRQRESTQQALLAEREATQRAELGRQRGWAVALAITVLGLTLVVALLLRQARERQAHAATLVQGNRALGEALHEAERLRARSEQVTHVNRRLMHLAGEEMRAPLLMLRGGAERLLVDDGSPELRARRIAAVAQATTELLRIADQMLESAALDPQAPPSVAPVALERLLRELVEQLRARAQGRAREIVLQQADTATVVADGARLSLALQEMLEQALAAAPAGGTVEVDLRRHGDAALLCIGDPGAGLPETDATGRRLAPSVSGGIGFAWACEVIEALGGTLARDSDGRGRRVLRIRLPCVEESARV